MQLKKSALSIAAMCLAGIASAGTITTPYVAGEFNTWNAGSDAMVESGVGTDIWTYSISGLTPNQRQEFKITDGTWDLSLPAANSWLYADGAGNITITYDGNTYADGWSTTTDRIQLNVDPGTWTAAGDFQHLIGGADWDNANPATAMVDQGGGIYTLTMADMAAGTYNWKAVVSGTWDAVSWDSRSINSANWAFTTDAVNNDVTLYLDAYDGTIKVDVIPEPSTIGLISLCGIGLLGARRIFKV